MARAVAAVVELEDDDWPRLANDSWCAAARRFSWVSPVRWRLPKFRIISAVTDVSPPWERA
jgi:hypothetical protein